MYLDQRRGLGPKGILTCLKGNISHNTPTHTTKQCRDLDVLADRLDRSAFRVDEAPQVFGGGPRGGGCFRGG
jgi:hypothetical protein